MHWYPQMSVNMGTITADIGTVSTQPMKGTVNSPCVLRVCCRVTYQDFSACYLTVIRIHTNALACLTGGNAARPWTVARACQAERARQMPCIVKACHIAVFGMVLEKAGTVRQRIVCRSGQPFTQLNSCTCSPGAWFLRKHPDMAGSCAGRG